MRDLDWSDVLDDADRMYQAQLDAVYTNLDALSTPDLEHKRYKIGEEARMGHFAMIDAYEIANHLVNVRNGTTCEGCGWRGGCMMCCPWDDGGLADAFNREAEEQMLGRPLFPNEY